MAREYPFELPLNVPFFYVGTLIQKIVDAKLWYELPVPLVNALSEASRNGTGIEITRKELDTIPDKVWEKALVAING